MVKKKKKNKKILGIWFADWANSFEDPRSAYYITLAISIVSFILLFSMVGPVNNATGSKTGLVTLVWIIIITFFTSLFLTLKIHSGISTHHCPKCKRIYAGEIYKQTHLGSRQRTAEFRVKEKEKVETGKKKFETGVEQIDTYHNKTKCKLCNHKWEYNSAKSTRVA